MMAVSAAATRWIKVSLHMAFAALAATALALMRSPIGYALLLALPALGWSRLVLQRHTPLEAGPRHDHRRQRSGRTALPVTGERVPSSGQPDRRARVPRRCRSQPQAPSSVGAAPEHTDAYRDYLSKHQAPHGLTFFIWLEAPRGLVGVVNVSESCRAAFAARTWGIMRSCLSPGEG